MLMSKPAHSALSPENPSSNSPVVVARYGSSSSKRTILVYGHYDVQPALKEDGWATEPFNLTIDDEGRMFGRGSTDDKGPVLGWLNSIQAYAAAGIDFPVNLLMCFEGMEESGSEGLDEFIKKEAGSGGFFQDVHAVCISDSYWLGPIKPCLGYGVRGVNYYELAITGPAQDLHSGDYGGAVYEPMTDVVKLLTTLVDVQGKILIPGVNELVAPLSDEEISIYETITYKMSDLHDAIGSETSIHEDVVPSLMSRWRFPSLSIHGIEGAFSAPGTKTVIPARPIAKFSIRTVPDVDANELDRLVSEHVNYQFSLLNSKNALEIKLVQSGPWWVGETEDSNFSAAKKAVKSVFNLKPDLTRGGGSIPITRTFQEVLKTSVLLLPMGSSTDAAHSVNEKLDKYNYIEGTKCLGAYLWFIAREEKVAVEAAWDLRTRRG